MDQLLFGDVRHLLSFYNTFTVAFLSLTYMPHISCQTECMNNDQCEAGYYCNNENYSCKKCVICENFQSSNTCVQSYVDCGSCLDGYKLNSLGKCERSNTVLTESIIGVLIVVMVLLFILVGGLFYLRRKKDMYFNHIGVVGANTITPTAPAACPPPPYSSDEHVMVINGHYNESYEPLFKQPLLANPQERQLEDQQRANPYSNCVNLPPNISRYSNGYRSTMIVEDDDTIESVSGVDDNIEEVNLGYIRQIPLIDNTSPPIVRTPTLNTPSSIQAANENRMILCEESREEESGQQRGAGTPPSPTLGASGAGSQQLVLQINNNTVINLQGNNTRLE